QRQEALRAYYDEAGGDLLWVGTTRAAGLVQHLERAEEDGLASDDYPAGQLGRLAAAVPAADPRSQAVIELHFSAAFLEYASDLQVGRFLPARVDPNFFLAPRRMDQFAALTGVANSDDVSAFFNRWQPSSPGYQGLKDLLADYREL